MHTDVHQFLYREVVGGGSTSKLSISSCTVPNDLHSLVRVSYGRVCVTTAETDTTNRAKVNTLVFSFSLESKGGQHHIRKILTTGFNSSFNTSCNLKYTSALCDLICTLLGNLLDLGDNENSLILLQFWSWRSLTLFQLAFLDCLTAWVWESRKTSDQVKLPYCFTTESMAGVFRIDFLLC